MTKKRAKGSKQVSSKKAAPKSSPIKFIGYAIVLVLIAYLIYSVYVYLGSVEKVEEFLICEDGECIKSIHIHADVNPIICGDKKWFPLEHGHLDEQHTHKDRNYAHFHERLKVHPQTHKYLDTAVLELSNLIKNMEGEFDGECMLGVCEGDICPGSDMPGTFRVIVNGEERPEKFDYVWENGDDIEVIFE